MVKYGFEVNGATDPRAGSIAKSNGSEFIYNYINDIVGTIAPEPSDLSFENTVFSYTGTTSNGTAQWDIATSNGNAASGASIELSNGTYIYYSVGGNTDASGTLAQITTAINNDY